MPCLRGPCGGERSWRVAGTYLLWVIRGDESLSIEEEAHAGDILSLTVAEGVHELAELSGALDLEEDLVVIVGDLDVEVLAGALIRLGNLW